MDNMHPYAEAVSLLLWIGGGIFFLFLFFLSPYFTLVSVSCFIVVLIKLVWQGGSIGIDFLIFGCFCLVFYLFHYKYYVKYNRDARSLDQDNEKNYVGHKCQLYTNMTFGLGLIQINNKKYRASGSTKLKKWDWVEITGVDILGFKVRKYNEH